MKRNVLYFIAAELWGIPGIPAEFTTSFYSVLGSMLICAAYCFIGSALAEGIDCIIRKRV